jgi:predicted ATP-grasp superfamily ATP-dependent carboligase
MIQTFHEEAAGNIVSVAGFIAKGSTSPVMLSSTKVLQRPVKTGVGLCFEGRDLLPVLYDRVLKLCKEVGYYGVFEAEFVHLSKQNRYLLIDFNTRFYGQMGFEIERGICQSLLALLGGVEAVEIRKILDHVGEQLKKETGIAIYRRRYMLRLLLLTQCLGGKISPEEVLQWRKWSKSHHGYDPVYTPDDPWPFFVDIGLTLKKMVRYPRSSWRTYFR